MSFYSNQQNIHPGFIDGDPTMGLHNRVCVCAERVLDSSLLQSNNESTQLLLSNYSPANPSPPFVFKHAHSTQVEGIITDLTINRLEERPHFARIRCSVVTPMRAIFEDANGEQYTADSQITTPVDVVMYVPAPSVFPFEVKAISSCNCPTGRYSGENEFTVTACLTIVLKVTAKTDLLIPSYGFCPAPRAIEFEREACSDFFDLPLYPSGNNRGKRSNNKQ